MPVGVAPPDLPWCVEGANVEYVQTGQIVTIVKVDRAIQPGDADVYVTIRFAGGAADRDTPASKLRPTAKSKSGFYAVINDEGLSAAPPPRPLPPASARPRRHARPGRELLHRTAQGARNAPCHACRGNLDLSPGHRTPTRLHPSAWLVRQTQSQLSSRARGASV